MIYYLLLIASIILSVSKSSLYNAYAKNTKPTISSTFNFNVVAYGSAILIPLVFWLCNRTSITVPTIVCAALYAIIVFSLQTISIAAMKVGTMVTTSICVMYGMMIPALAGPIFWHESFGVLQAVGITLMIISLWLLNAKTENKNEKIPKKWLLLSGLAFLLSGFAGLMEKIHQSTNASDEKGAFVTVACIFLFIISIISKFSIREDKSKNSINKSTLLFAIPAGVVIGFYSTINLTLAGALDAMIYYPVANGGALILTMIISIVVFKEKLDIRKSIGLVLGLLGILCLSIPI